MNFLAHYQLATRYQTPLLPLPAYVLGSALPDLLPLAAPRSRFRLSFLDHAPGTTDEDRALLAGVRRHLEADAAFHKAPAFAQAQSAVSGLAVWAGFESIRVRRFFLAHILVELALDAVLLRGEPRLGDRFYAAFEAADYGQTSRWAEATVGRPLPALPAVLARFAHARYLTHYADDVGVAEGINQLCMRARQDTFTGANAGRLVQLVAQAVLVVGDLAGALMAETAAAASAPHDREVVLEEGFGVH